MGKEGLVLALLGAGLVYWFWDDINAAIGIDSDENGDGGTSGDNTNTGSDSGPGGEDVAASVNSDLPRPPWTNGGSWMYTGPISTGTKIVTGPESLAVLTAAGSAPKNFWQWNYFYKQVTGFDGPDPIALMKMQKGDVENTPLTFEQWHSLINKAKSTGMGKLFFPGAFADPIGRANIRPTGAELWRAGL